MITQEATITIVDGWKIEIEREHRQRGEDPGAWYKRHSYDPDKISRSSMHRLIKVARENHWDYSERLSYYGYNYPEYEYFTLSDIPGTGEFLARYLMSMCPCVVCQMAIEIDEEQS
jgi:hypothetical protein